MALIRPKVLLYESMDSEGTVLLKKTCDLTYASSLDEEALLPLVADVDAIIIRANGAITKKLIQAAPKLKVIGRHGIGLDAIDLNAAKEAGVRVVNTPRANVESVAEHFVALALILAKKIRQADLALRAGDWNARYQLIGTEIYGKTLGVLGFGRIGQQTAGICHRGFAMPVIYHDVIPWPKAEAELGARKVSPEALFVEADFISINLPLLEVTRHSVNADLIGRMKKTAVLINMARGPVWDEKAVLAALESNAIAGAGADVFEVEPASPDNPLFKMDNFVGTPHMSAHTREGMIRMSLVAKDVLAVLDGCPPENLVC